jgi:hypothetical protein
MASGLKSEQGMSREITGDKTGKKRQGTGGVVDVNVLYHTLV